MSAAVDQALLDAVGSMAGVFDMPCPECSHRCESPLNRRRRVLRVWKRSERFLSFNCVRCGWRGFAGESDRTSIKAVLSRHPRASANHKGDGARSSLALALWDRALPLAGSPAETYLASRGVRPVELVLASDSLRFLQECPFGKDRHPAMLALLRDILTDEPRAVHRTALRRDGSGKASLAADRSPKMMLGPAGGCVVKLVGDVEVTLGLGIAEGIENALTALCAGWSPVWACGSKGGLGAFPVLAGIEALTIFSDPEPGGVEAARRCAIRWRAAGREATVMIPSDGDCNDVRRAT